MALVVVSCQPTPATNPPTPQRTEEPDESKGTITVESVDGEPLSPEAEQAFAELGRHLLQKAVTEALKKGMEELYQKLKISDEIEKRLLAVQYGGGKDQATDTWSVYLIRPSNETLPPETIEVTRDSKSFIRFTRVFTKVEMPVAIMSLRRITDGKLNQSELILVYDPKAGWQPHRPTVTNENLEPDKH
jgi:hypothetical protein